MVPAHAVVFRQLGVADESALLEGLGRFGGTSGPLEEWLKVHEYLVGTLPPGGKRTNVMQHSLGGRCAS